MVRAMMVVMLYPAPDHARGVAQVHELLRVHALLLEARVERLDLAVDRRLLG